VGIERGNGPRNGPDPRELWREGRGIELVLQFWRHAFRQGIGDAHLEVQQGRQGNQQGVVGEQTHREAQHLQVNGDALQQLHLGLIEPRLQKKPAA
jgi:hypothetical protein